MNEFICTALDLSGKKEKSTGKKQKKVGWKGGKIHYKKQCISSMQHLRLKSQRGQDQEEVDQDCARLRRSG